MSLPPVPILWTSWPWCSISISAVRWYTYINEKMGKTICYSWVSCLGCQKSIRVPTKNSLPGIWWRQITDDNANQMPLWNLVKRWWMSLPPGYPAHVVLPGTGSSMQYPHPYVFYLCFWHQGINIKWWSCWAPPQPLTFMPWLSMAQVHFSHML